MKSADWIWTPRPPTPAESARGGWALQRRGVHHGFVHRAGRGAAPAPSPRDVARLWPLGEPIRLPRILAPGLRATTATIRRTRAMFERLRRNSEFADEVWRRVGRRREIVPAGVSVDLGDPREIEKVHADQRVGSRVERDLWAKLSWVSVDERDSSLRVRFSFGSERLEDWKRDRRRAEAADRFAEAVFPECQLLTRHRGLQRILDGTGRGRARLSERIVYSNAPGGGAAFHHDAETRQRGVVFAQLAGRTAWLALPKRELAEIVAGLARGSLVPVCGTPGKAMRALDRGGPPALDRLLNRSRRLTRVLVERSRFVVLGPGDVLLLPSPAADAVAWHSVFGLGGSPSLAHSYGIFAAG